MKHTPWNIADPSDFRSPGHVIHDPSFRRIALVQRADDAALIAAAPDLLEALRHVVTRWTIPGYPPPHIWRDALAAIARAEGRGHD